MFISQRYRQSDVNALTAGKGEVRNSRAARRAG
jgi:hypothetical protein